METIIAMSARYRLPCCRQHVTYRLPAAVGGRRLPA
jgi:hypothetical protein